ncbi:glycerol-3-phosphate dehydrogenase [Alsobacter sp. SYSU M60028]|uniref:Glycerol-3-phosphate dehydrogenase n=1 Tax=Alsobacter ponti TaxID=2962936 RepID=A0ABT1LJH9_9HYPH|nr:glycerol-3-phosphate dehydrogenase [Alsobacter ponti]
MTRAQFDIAVIGGGVNGCGIARDAAGRGQSVVLFEKGDLAGATSSASTKLIHGGLRYLEHYKFRLVRESLVEREVLLQAAPHIIWPLRFVLPHHKGLRPAWLLRLGLFLYDHLGGRRILPATRRVDLTREPAGKPLKPTFRLGFEYSDCWVEDSRLVVLSAVDAAERGADIRVGARVVSARREEGCWRIVAEDAETGARSEATARILVNAAGPWVGEVISGVVGANLPAGVRLVKGSHVVVSKLFEGGGCYIFQNADNRIVFAISYERDFTLIGTTDVDYRDDPAKVAATPEEAAYLCKAASEYFATPVSPADVVWSYAGVRPLYDDGASSAQEATRDYVLALDDPPGAPPLLSVFGGKITTFRRLAEAALDRLAPHLPPSAARRKGWTGRSVLPGGDFAWDGYDDLVASVLARWPGLRPGLAARLVRAYGTRVAVLLEGRGDGDDLGRVFGADLTEAEVDYLMDHEWARTAADVLWRRSKLGLRVDADGVAALEAYMRQRRAGRADAPVHAAVT